MFKGKTSSKWWPGKLPFTYYHPTATARFLLRAAQCIQAIKSESVASDAAVEYKIVRDATTGSR